jgi:LysM repeat protein
MGINIRISAIVFSFFICFSLHSQTVVISKDSVIEKGRVFLKHQVAAKQTLYSISKLYDISQDTIIAFNPELDMGLKAGQVILIPKGFAKKSNQNKPKTPQATYTVQEKETLYSIAKRFNTSVEALENLNPDVKKGLKKGAILKLPIQTEIAKVDTILPKEEEKKPIKKVCLPIDIDKRNQSYSMAFLLPFHSKSTDNSKSQFAIDFFNGAKLALDSLNQLGFMAEVNVYDTSNDSTVIDKLFDKQDFSKSDIIIGPLYSSAFVEAAVKANKKDIPIVAPFAQNKLIIEKIPSAIKVTPDVKRQYINLVKAVQKGNQNANVILLKNANPADKDNIQLIKQAILESDYIPLKEIDYVGISSLKENLVPGKTNVVFFPSTAQAQVLDFCSKAQSLLNNFSIVLVGLNDWNNYESINYEQLNKLKFHFVNTTHSLSESEFFERFAYSYKALYKKEPTVYAQQGFDVAWFFGKCLWEYGKDFSECLPYIPSYQGINNRYEFKRNNVSNGFENTQSNVLKIEEMKMKYAHE